MIEWCYLLGTGTRRVLNVEKEFSGDWSGKTFRELSADTWDNCQAVVLEMTLENPLDSKEMKPVNPKGNQPWIFIGKTDAEAPILQPPDAESWLIGKDPDTGKDWRQKEKRETEDGIVGWHHQLNGHEFEQTPGNGEGQGSLVCCSPWGHKGSDTTEWLNNPFFQEEDTEAFFCPIFLITQMCLNKKKKKKKPMCGIWALRKLLHKFPFLWILYSCCSYLCCSFTHKPKGSEGLQDQPQSTWLTNGRVGVDLSFPNPSPISLFLLHLERIMAWQILVQLKGEWEK